MAKESFLPPLVSHHFFLSSLPLHRLFFVWPRREKLPSTPDHWAALSAEGHRWRPRLLYQWEERSLDYPVHV